MSAIWVEIVEARGSTPRDAGTAMKVTRDGIEGTIGGGALEFQAIEDARAMLVDGTDTQTQRLALGPALGQCCGGAVTLRFGRTRKQTDIAYFNVHRFGKNPRNPKFLWIWGAGHVGRAVIQKCPPQAFRVTWVDDAVTRFPKLIPAYAKATPAKDMSLLASHAPKDAHHLIFTYSHDIDFTLCHALLQRGAASIGLIGSATKWARFRKRLSALGHSDNAIDQIECPIGDPSLGKHPQQIAEGVVAGLLRTKPKREVA